MTPAPVTADRLPPILTSPAKRLRSHLIADHLAAAARPPRVVVFTCGNAAAALRDAGLDVLEVGGRGPITPTRWWTPEEIAAAWPDRFDATPGHLPVPLLVRLAAALRDHHGHLHHGTYLVPTGSGETLLALRLAYPRQQFIPLHSDDPAITLADARNAPILQLPQMGGPVYMPEYRT